MIATEVAGRPTRRCNLADFGRAPSAGEKAAAIAIGTIALAPLIWLLGLSPIAYHVAGVCIVLTLLLSGTRGGVVLGVTEILLLSYCLAYVLSLMVNWHSTEPDRLLASCYNLSLWLIGVMMVFAGRNAPESRSLLRLERAVTWVLAFSCLGAGVALSAWMLGSDRFVVLSPISPLFGVSPDLEAADLFNASVRLNILVNDWLLDASLPRLSVLAPYPVALAGLILCCLPLAVSRAFSCPRLNIAAAVVATLSLFTLALTLSRIAVLALVVSAFLILAVRRVPRLVLLIAAFALAALLSFLFVPSIEELFWVREASTAYRLEMYGHALRIAAGEAMLLGLGSKPRISSFTIPVGSHSTYLGAFIKTGLLGAFIFALVALQIGFRAFVVATRARCPSYVALATSVFAILIWMATEDIDAPQLVAFLFWFEVGLLQRRLPAAGCEPHSTERPRCR